MPGMTQSCGVDEEHKAHFYLGERKLMCAGFTRCGEGQHPAHYYTVKEKTYCYGRKKDES